MTIPTQQWHLDSVAYGAVSAWTTGASKAVGAFIRPTSPAIGNERVFVCVAAGTTHASTEPSWDNNKGHMTTDNTVTWQEVTGNAAMCGNNANTIPWLTVKNDSVALGFIIRDGANARYFICTSAGTTGNGAEPTWNTTAGATTTDNGVTWTTLGTVGSFVTAFGAAHARIAVAFDGGWFKGNDLVWIGDDHAETGAAAVSLQFPTSGSAKGYCVDHTKVSPASADFLETASVTTTGGNMLHIAQNNDGSKVYIRGVKFKSSSHITFLNNTGGDGLIVLDHCRLEQTSTGSLLFNGANHAALTILKSVVCKFGDVSNGFLLGGGLVWDGGSVDSGGTAPDALFNNNTSLFSMTHVKGVDLSFLGSGKDLVGNNVCGGLITLEDCLINAAVTVSAPQISPGSGLRVDVIRCDSGGARNRDERHWYEGDFTTEFTIIRTAGSSDGAIGRSYKIVTTANPQWTFPFTIFSLGIWNAVTLSNVNVTVEGLMNAAALPNNDDIWFDVDYLGTSSSTLGATTSGSKANDFATGSAWTASTEAWDSLVSARANTHAYSLGDVIKLASNPGRIFFCTTAGTSAGSEPGGYSSAVDGGSVTDGSAVFRAAVRFAMTVTLSSPQPTQIGAMKVNVSAAKPSTTFYLDPKPTLS